MQRKILSVAAAVIFAVTATVTVYAESAEKLCYLENTDKSGIGVSAVSAILIEADTGTVLFSKNEKEHRQIASTTKIMTALLTLEAGEPDKEFEVDPTAIKVEGTSMGLREGDIVTRRALCYGMLLPSGNDAANAAAVNISGSKSAFAVLMNKRAEEIGMTDTNFVTPSRLVALMSSLWLFRIVFTMDKPRPTPSLSRLRDLSVLWKRSKTKGSSSGQMHSP